MKTLKVISSFLLLFSAHSNAAWQERELNTWYEKDRVLYDITQTVDDNPVMISIAQAGYKTANLTISYMSNGGCSKTNPPLRINNTIVPAAYKCVPVDNNKIEHYIVDDADKVNALVRHLKSDFTAVIQKDIKIWAANIKSPKYGMAPKFWRAGEPKPPTGGFIILTWDAQSKYCKALQNSCSLLTLLS